MVKMLKATRIDIDEPKEIIEKLKSEGWSVLKVFPENKRDQAERFKDVEERMRNKKVKLIKGNLSTGLPIIYFMEK